MAKFPVILELRKLNYDQKEGREILNPEFVVCFPIARLDSIRLTLQSENDRSV